MPVTIEKSGAVWTVILSRPKARNAVNPETATKLYDTFLAFDRDQSAAVAVSPATQECSAPASI